MLHKEATRAIDYRQLKISSTAFQYGELIPSKYTCDGINISPPLDIENIPEDAKCLAIIVDDPDAPNTVWVHWIVWNIPITHHMKENIVQGEEGLNDFEKHCYMGPCPPSGTHRYFFKIYALGKLLTLPSNTRKPELEKAFSEYIIGFGELVGLYKRNK